MSDPLFWLSLSLLLLAISLILLLLAALPTLRELRRAAQSAERLLNTLDQELPPTLEALRLTSQELTELADDINDGVQSAGRVVQQVDQSLDLARHQVHQVNVGGRSLWAGLQGAWASWRRSGRRPPPAAERLKLPKSRRRRSTAHNSHHPAKGARDPLPHQQPPAGNPLPSSFSHLKDTPANRSDAVHPSDPVNPSELD